MPLGLYPNETRDLLAGGMGEDMPPVQPGFFQGALGATLEGIPRGLESTRQAVETGATSLVTGLLPSSETMFRAGAMGMAVPELPISPEQIDLDRANAANAAVKQYTPDPHTVGTAGQVLNGMASGVTRLVAGTAFTGSPLVGAALVGTTEGAATHSELVAAGVDPTTTNVLSAGSALFSGAGALLPGGLGKTLTMRLATGASIQLEAGVANRAMMHTVLAENGYDQMAKSYQPLDGAAMLADAVLGAGFGAVHHLWAKPSDIDAAHAVKDAQQVERGADGPAADPVSRTNIVDNNTKAAETLVAGRETPANYGDVRVVPDPAQEAAREATAAQVDEAGREVAGKPVEAPVEPQTPSDIIAALKEEAAQGTEVPKSTLSRAARAEEAATETAAQLDPATQEAVGQAQEALTRHEGLQIEDENGRMVDANEALQRSLDDIKNAQGDSELHRIAAACLGRG